MDDIFPEGIHFRRPPKSRAHADAFASQRLSQLPLVEAHFKLCETHAQMLVQVVVLLGNAHVARTCSPSVNQNFHLGLSRKCSRKRTRKNQTLLFSQLSGEFIASFRIRSCILRCSELDYEEVAAINSKDLILFLSLISS